MCSIWSLLVLRDSTLISGDNHGRVQLWNGYSGNELLSTFHQHSSTVLSLVANEKEDAVFASGEDSRVICLRRLSSRSEAPSSLFPSSDLKRSPMLESMLNCQWVYTSSHRPHSHDVRSLAVATQIGPNAQPKSVLISGGVDSKLCMYSVDDFTSSRPSWILPIPARYPSPFLYLYLSHLSLQRSYCRLI
jgi:U3 small nucleolar RNA-associated protein 4